MASISRKPNNRRCIQFTDANGKRRTIYLGRMTQKYAEVVKGKIEALQAATLANVPWDSETATWLGNLSPALYGKLVSVGLVPDRKKHDETLESWLNSYFELREDAKESTLVCWGHTRRCLIEFFGASTTLNSITSGDADAWRIWLKQKEKIGRKHHASSLRNCQAVLSSSLSEGTDLSKSIRGYEGNWRGSQRNSSVHGLA